MVEDEEFSIVALPEMTSPPWGLAKQKEICHKLKAKKREKYDGNFRTKTPIEKNYSLIKRKILLFIWIIIKKPLLPRKFPNQKLLFNIVTKKLFLRKSFPNIQEEVRRFLGEKENYSAEKVVFFL
jgi:hypothetical protein